VVVLRKAFTTFLHANLKVNFGFVLASPVFHGVHHSADPRDYDANFAGTFPLWDVLFGTAKTVQPLSFNRMPTSSASFPSPPGVR
jgi:sterol desaturase/sphingolipid hydroxylase (fatty acid hydroxylase superfamily)